MKRGREEGKREREEDYRNKLAAKPENSKRQKESEKEKEKILSMGR